MLLNPEVVGYYPFTPIVVNGGVSSFRIMLERSLDFIEQNVPDEEQYGIICSWNEVTEGAALLPKLTEGKVDFGYLNILKRVLLDRNNLK